MHKINISLESFPTARKQDTDIIAVGLVVSVIGSLSTYATVKDFWVCCPGCRFLCYIFLLCFGTVSCYHALQTWQLQLASVLGNQNNWIMNINAVTKTTATCPTICDELAQFIANHGPLSVHLARPLSGSTSCIQCQSFLAGVNNNYNQVVYIWLFFFQISSQYCVFISRLCPPKPRPIVFQ